MIGRLETTVIDCPDPPALARFYAGLLGWAVTRADGHWVELSDESGKSLSFQLAADLLPPRWPDPRFPQQFHLDIRVDDVDAAEGQVLALGAIRLDGEGAGFRVFADPAGHPFCLVFDAV